MTRTRERGFTLIELVVTTALLGILAAAAVPLFEVSVKRTREIELRAALRQMRRALDQFHASYVASGGAGGGPGVTNVPAAPPPGTPSKPLGGGQAPNPTQTATGDGIPRIDISQFDPIDSKGYPPNLKVLVEGVAAFGGGTDDKDKVKFLRRIPLDPMIAADQINPSDDNLGWGVRSYQDAPDAITWGRQNVYDVYTKGSGKALDGTKYKEW